MDNMVQFLTDLGTNAELKRAYQANPAKVLAFYELQTVANTDGDTNGEDTNKAIIFSQNNENKAIFVSPSMDNKALIFAPKMDNKAVFLAPQMDNKAILLSPEM